MLCRDNDRISSIHSPSPFKKTAVVTCCLQWLVRLANSRWLSHLKEVLNTACLAAQCLERVGASVLLTETTGTDLSLAVSSLAQVILNPDTRCG